MTEIETIKNMKKYIIGILFTLFIMTGCEKIYNEDPYIKESERLLVLEKAKTDTTSIYLESDNKFFVVKEGKIVKSGLLDILAVGATIIMVLVAFVIGLVAGLSSRQ